VCESVWVSQNVNDGVAMTVRLFGFVTVSDVELVALLDTDPVSVILSVAEGVGTGVMVVYVWVISGEKDFVTVLDFERVSLLMGDGLEDCIGEAVDEEVLVG
jgi:hypothetical protein